MRVTADRTDPDFRAEYLGCKVFLDGVEQRDCLEADDVAGTVIVLARDEKDNILFKDGNLEHELRNGVVRIELPAGLFRPSWPA